MSAQQEPACERCGDEGAIGGITSNYDSSGEPIEVWGPCPACSPPAPCGKCGGSGSNWTCSRCGWRVARPRYELKAPSPQACKCACPLILKCDECSGTGQSQFSGQRADSGEGSC